MNLIDVMRPHFGPPVDLDGIIRALPGVSMDNSLSLDDQISGQLKKVDAKNYIISVNTKHSSARQRFTIAHELGHYLLHRHLLGDGVDDNKDFQSDLAYGNFRNTQIKRVHELEANRFAAQLLMPKVKLIEKSSETDDVAELAQIFDVSGHSMAIRLKGLGFGLNASDPQYAEKITRRPSDTLSTNPINP